MIAVLPSYDNNIQLIHSLQWLHCLFLSLSLYIYIKEPNKRGEKFDCSAMASEDLISFVGMTKSQLYDLLCQLKSLIEEDRERARRVLIENPSLTRGFLQAQIMLGMVQSTSQSVMQSKQMKPSTQQVVSQPTSRKVVQQSNIQNMQSTPVQSQNPSQTNSSQPLVSAKPQLSISLSSASNPPSNLQSQTEPSVRQHATLQAMRHSSAQVPPISGPQSSQINNLPLPPPSTPPRYSSLNTHAPAISNQTQPSLQKPGVFNLPHQPPLPPQPRPPSVQPFSHQLHPQVPHSLGYQPTSGPQPMFQSVSAPSSSFPQGQPPLPSQPPPQQLYQGGAYIGSDYNNPGKPSMQSERGAPWAPGMPERAKDGPHYPGSPSLVSSRMSPGSSSSQMPHTSQLTPEMEKAVLEQVRSLTPEQINGLPPDQRQQVIDLQKMLMQ